jgi:hypothetical protein
MTKLTKKTTSVLITEFLKDPERKSLLRITAEVLYLSFVFRGFAHHYFSRYMFKKGVTNIRDYYPDNFLNFTVKPRFNNREVIDVLENKLYFNFFYSQFNVSLPKILMYNHKKMFVADNKCIEVNTIQHFRKLLEDIFRQNPTYDSIFIKKTYWSFGGDKVHKLFRNQLSNNAEVINVLYTDVLRSGFLFQETVRQHPDLDKLNPSCLNTIRIDTFIDKDGNIDVLSGYIRMSLINSHLDNITSGGCQVNIDLETGRLNKYGYFTIRSNGIKVATVHPVTDTLFENFQIPYIPEVKEFVKRVASYMPELRLIGWDVAIGESGPVLIEGNSNYDMQGNDLAYGGYRSNAVFRKVLEELKYS